MPKDNVIVLPAGSKIYWVRTDLEMERLYSNTMGRFDDAGEPYVYSRQATGFLLEDTVVTITKRRGVQWHGWGRRPPFLVEGFATNSTLSRIISFQHH
jgi:hypothetical protein